MREYEMFLIQKSPFTCKLREEFGEWVGGFKVVVHCKLFQFFKHAQHLPVTCHF